MYHHLPSLTSTQWLSLFAYSGDASDGARDMLHFLSFYLPDRPTCDPLPTHLPRLADAIADSRIQHGIPERTIVAIGHSLGGSCL
jgi:surfactin synthase thioesterase subunit